MSGSISVRWRLVLVCPPLPWKMLAAQEHVSFQKVVSELVLYSSMLELEGRRREDGEYGRSKSLSPVVQNGANLARGITLCLGTRTVSGPGELWTRLCDSYSLTP